MPKTNLRQQIFIDALPSKVWRVLTSCEYINQYFPGVTVHSQWTEGSSITAKAKTEEATETIQKGKVLQAIPGVMLKYELLEEPALNTAVITYEIIPAGDGIELKFHSEGFADTQDAYFLRIKETKLLLQKIKWLAEYV